MVVIGGNRLSRGLTLEGLTVSYFIRRANTYDTLMQMERWFGYREGYADLTRVYTTTWLEQWFRDLAMVEDEVRGDIARYQQEGLTPLDVGVRIRSHPAMLVTSPLKMGTGRPISVAFADQLQQTVTFPFDDSGWFTHNVDLTRRFLSDLGRPGTERNVPMWTRVPGGEVLAYVQAYRTDPNATRVRSELLARYIEEQMQVGELAEWSVGVMERPSPDPRLGTIDLGVVGRSTVGLIERTRLTGQNSVKAITSPEDQTIGMTDTEQRRFETLRQSFPDEPQGPLSRRARDPHRGLLLIYPVSKHSGVGRSTPGRTTLFNDPSSADHVIGLAVVFPASDSAVTVPYIVGSVGVGRE